MLALGYDSGTECFLIRFFLRDTKCYISAFASMELTVNVLAVKELYVET